MLHPGKTASRRSRAARAATGSGARGIFLGSCFVGVAAVVGDVKAAAFKNESRARADEAFHRSGTFSLRAIREMWVLHGLARLKAVSAGLAFVVVGRHNRMFR